MQYNMWDYIQDDLTSIVLIDEKTNTLTIKIYGLHNKKIAENFAQYAMNLLDFDYNTAEYSMLSTRIHQIWILRYLTPLENTKPFYIIKYLNIDGRCQFAIGGSAKQYV